MASFKSVCIVIVDDSRQMRSLLRGALVGFGFSNIHETSSTASARATIDTGAVDLVLVDYWLANEKGVELCRAVRNDPNRQINCLPLIMITGDARESRVREAINAGVDEYLIKPVTPADLAGRINAVIDKRRPFVRTSDFHGPDRRRGAAADFGGPFRRFDDEADLEI